MDLTQSLNLNTAIDHPLFDPKFLNLDYWFNQILQFFRSTFGISLSPNFIFYMHVILASLSLLFIIVIIYCIRKLLRLRALEHAYLEHEIIEYAQHKKEREKKKEISGITNERWHHVLGYLASTNSSDWKLAIMEADSMLEDLTERLELEGDTLGERLKSTDKDKFKSLNDAWEAHIVRNRIAHEGAKFELTQREANRVAVLYENVFREFGIL